MVLTLALEAAIATTIAAIAAAGSAGVGIYSAINSSQRAKKQESLARERAAIQSAQEDARTRQERSVIARRFVQQVDAQRVLAGASGVSGGASQVVLESGYAAQADADLAVINANRGRAGLAINNDLAGGLNRADSMRQNVFAAAAQGAIQGFGVYRDLSGSLTRRPDPVPQNQPTQQSSNPDTIGGASQGVYGSPER